MKALTQFAAALSRRCVSKFAAASITMAACIWLSSPVQGESIVVEQGNQVTRTDDVRVNPGEGVVVRNADSQLDIQDFLVVEGGTVRLESGGRLNTNTTTGHSRLAGGGARAVIDGAGSTWTVRGYMEVGDSSEAHLVISNGGKVRSGLAPDNRSRVSGAGPDAPASTATITGHGSLWSAGSRFAVGDSGEAHLKIESGGRLESGLDGNDSRVLGGGELGEPFSTATVTGAGSIWVVGGDLGIGGTNGAQLRVADGGLLDVSESIAGNGVLIIDAGRVEAQWIRGDVRIRGAGTIQSDVASDGATVVGGSTGLLTIGGDFTQTPTASLAMELAGRGGVAGVDLDRLIVQDIATLSGHIDVTLLDGFAPALGDSFELVRYGSLQFGNAGGLAPELRLPALAPELTWRSNFGPNALIISVQAIPEPASLTLAFMGLVVLIRLPRRLFILCTVAVSSFVFLEGQLQAQIYFTGPYGPGGTWNLYEHRGFFGAERFQGAVPPTTWSAAHQDAISRVEPFSGTNAPGHLATISGPLAQQENDFLWSAVKSNQRSTWIGLTDSEEFGGGEAGTNGMAGFGNPPGDRIGWKWTSGEVFDFANWAGNQPNADSDAVTVSGTGGKWFAASGTNSYIVEYETRSATPINVPIPAPTLVPGLPPRVGAFGIREVASNGTIAGPIGSGSVGGAIQSLRNIGPGALVRDYYAPVVDHQAEFVYFGPSVGPGRPFEVLQRGDIAFSQLNQFSMVAHGQILVPEGQGGEWTFSVNSDDGYELYIPGAKFQPNNGPYFTPYGSFRREWGVGRDLATVTLQSGIHDVELVYFENVATAAIELSASRGHKTSFDNSFALVGAPAQNVVGRTPAITTRFNLVQVRRMPDGPGELPPAEQVKSLADAKVLLAAPDANDLTATSVANTLNHDNITAAQIAGRYQDDVGFLVGNDIAVKATASLSIATAGTYTFGFYVLDGAELTIAGAKFSESFGEGSITGGGQSLTLDRSTSDGVAFAAVDLMPGTYPLEFVTFNRDGDSLAELFVAPGRVEYFDASAFALLGPTPTNINYVRPAGLQLVPEPATLTNLALAGLFVTSYVAARRFKRWPCKP